MQINIENECPANDNCFIRPVGIDVALKVLKDECPMPISTFYNLSAPGITFTYKGGDLYRALEHVDKRFFGDMLCFIHNLMIQIGPDDAQTYLDKTKDEALSALKVQNTDQKSKTSDDQKDENKKDSSKNVNTQAQQAAEEKADTLAKTKQEDLKKENQKKDDPVRI